MASWSTLFNGAPPAPEHGLEWGYITPTVETLRGLERPRDVPFTAAEHVEDGNREKEVRKHINEHGELHDTDCIHVQFVRAGASDPGRAATAETDAPYLADNGAVFKALDALPPHTRVPLRYKYVNRTDLLRTRGKLEFGKNRCPVLDHELFMFGWDVVAPLLALHPRGVPRGMLTKALAESGVSFFTSKTRAAEAVEVYTAMANNPAVAENYWFMTDLAVRNVPKVFFTWAMITSKPFLHAPPDVQRGALVKAKISIESGHSFKRPQMEAALGLPPPPPPAAVPPPPATLESNRRFTGTGLDAALLPPPPAAVPGAGAAAAAAEEVVGAAPSAAAPPPDGCGGGALASGGAALAGGGAADDDEEEAPGAGVAAEAAEETVGAGAAEEVVAGAGAAAAAAEVVGAAAAEGDEQPRPPKRKTAALADIRRKTQRLKDARAEKADMAEQRRMQEQRAIQDRVLQERERSDLERALTASLGYLGVTVLAEQVQATAAAAIQQPPPDAGEIAAKKVQLLKAIDWANERDSLQPGDCAVCLTGANKEEFYKKMPDNQMWAVCGTCVCNTCTLCMLEEFSRKRVNICPICRQPVHIRTAKPLTQKRVGRVNARQL